MLKNILFIALTVLRNCASLFVKKIDENTVVIDVRDEFQREHTILVDTTKNIPLGKVNIFAKRQAAQGKTLLIYDAVGKQVKWLQYYLEKIKIKDYFFMKKGVKGYKEANL